MISLSNRLKVLAALFLLAICPASWSSSEEKPVERDYSQVRAAPAPANQTAEDVRSKSEGCVSCHTESDAKTMHVSTAVRLGCTDCHGGNPSVFNPMEGQTSHGHGDSAYDDAREKAHVLPRYPHGWHYPHSANPERTYTLLNRESPEFVRFVNPSDFRAADDACGACHQNIIEASKRSMHATGAMLWGGAAYNNGILPFKNYILGESYDNNGQAQIIKGPELTGEAAEIAKSKSVLPQLFPLPAWETIYPADIFRVFERGGRNISNLFPETGIPNALGLMQRIEEPGKPDFRQSNRGPGTGGRIAVPVINITKTRLNDPFLWFMGTNDQPGDYRHSGCASCHVVYANDRDPRHSGKYAVFGHEGKTRTVDPTIPKDESGHPLQHQFTRSIPTSQCMICHMHQPNMFVNTFLGYTMWDYESDAPLMWPEKQVYPTIEEQRKVNERNPEAAAARGKWADVEFLKNVSDLNDRTKDTRFADYHGHGWNFRAIYKRDRHGNLLDADGNQVSDDDPKKFDKAVHMSSIHLDVGMHCVDCHFSNDNHGNGYIHGEVAAAVEVGCKDCHGTVKNYPNLFTSGPAALEGGVDMAALRTPDGRRRFEWVGDKLLQRSMMDPELEWEMSLVKDSVTPDNPHYNAKAARAKLMGRDTTTQSWGLKETGANNLAHDDDNIECYACHQSWTTSCGGCHLPIEANWKTERHHYEGGESRNFATYNPQVARDEIFHLAKREPHKGGKYAPARSTSALVLSSTNSNREKIYIQQPPIAASGYSSQALNPHFAHTVRKTETRVCSDCHLSKDNDNNAIMAQTLMLGTNFINFVGFNAWVGGEEEINAVPVTEWDEPQAVIGSYLHRYAYPDYFKAHQDRGMVLPNAYSHAAGGTVSCIQLRGEYVYLSEGEGGVRVYDAAAVANKGYSQRFIDAPFSPLGHDTHVKSKDASCVALPTTQPIAPWRNQGDLMRVDNMEQPIHPLYNYMFITDRQEGLILVDINTLTDGEPRNNFLERALTWNEGGVLNGARHVTIGGHYLYIIADAGLVVLNIDDPLQPTVATTVPLNRGHSSMQEFRYLFVTDADGLKVVDVTHPEQAHLVNDNVIPLNDARRVFVSRTYAYVAAGAEGLVIVDVENPERMKRVQAVTEGIVDASDVIVATTNASLFAYVADGTGGLKILQLTSPELQPKFYGFAPAPNPRLIASRPTDKPARSLSRPLERDRAVDETGGQVAVFGRRGARPLNQEEMHKLYLDKDGKPWYVEDNPTLDTTGKGATTGVNAS
ncbi:MAG: multiheme c-type cytochrome, partial [Pseudomonadales bacterium]